MANAIAGACCITSVSSALHCTAAHACSYLDVVWIFFLIIMLPTHQVCCTVTEVLEQLERACESLFGTAALFHVCPGDFMSKLIL